MESSFFDSFGEENVDSKNFKRPKEVVQVTSMFPRNRRLVSRTDYKEVYKFGKSVNGKFFRVSFLNTNFQSRSKIGVVVSNKVSKKATERNKIKRVVRSYLRDSMVQDAGFKIVVVARAESLGTDVSSLKQDLSEIFGKLFSK